MKDLRKYVAEFIGTFVLVLVACGTAIVTGCGTPEGGIAAYLTTAGAFGLVIVAMAYSIGNISGCHINPAVSLAMLVSKKMNFKDFICYVIAQVLGAIAAAAILNAMFKATGANVVSESLGENKEWKGFLMEAILTCRRAHHQRDCQAHHHHQQTIERCCQMAGLLIAGPPVTFLQEAERHVAARLSEPSTIK